MPAEKEVPLGWIEASEKLRDRKITWGQYLHHIFLHCLPEWHAIRVDSKGRPDSTIPQWLYENDTFAATVYWYHDRIHSLQDSTKLEEIIHVAERGTLSELRLRLDALAEDARLGIINSVALMALQGRKLPLLRFCAENYPVRNHGGFFENAAVAVKEDKEPELYELIKTSYRRYWRAWRETGGRDIREKC